MKAHKWIYTEKAEKDGIGKAGDTVDLDKDELGTAYLDAHGYAIEHGGDSASVTSAALDEPKAKGAMDSPKKKTK